MNKYGLQLRIQPLNRQQVGPPVSCAPGFSDSDEEDNDVNRDIARQATTKKTLRDVEEQQKKALQEDPSVFEYDGVYEQMKEAVVRPVAKDRQERKSKYIPGLMDKAREREREHEIIYERKLAKERSKDEHFFADKDKFITSAYKKKLAEQAKWLEEECLRELHEEKNAACKKNDISDFYFNLSKNIAFGAKVAEFSRPVKQEATTAIDNSQEEVTQEFHSLSNFEKTKARDQDETLCGSKNDNGSLSRKSDVTSCLQGNILAEHLSSDKNKAAHHKREEDAQAAAKERFLARKKAKLT